MTRAAALPTLLLLVAACSSAPTTERPSVPGRPEVQRPDGVEPDGLAEIRDTLGEQRSAARERTDALVVKPNDLSQTNDDASWLETAYSWVGESIAQVVGLWRLLGL